MDAEKKLGKQIRQLRKERGYTQAQLAELVGIDDKHLSKIENGVHLPAYKTIKSLSEVLKFDLRILDKVSLEERPLNQNPIYFKAIKVLNSAKNKEELVNYYQVLKLASRMMNSTNKK